MRDPQTAMQLCPLQYGVNKNRKESDRGCRVSILTTDSFFNFKKKVVLSPIWNEVHCTF